MQFQSTLSCLTKAELKIFSMKTLISRVVITIRWIWYLKSWISDHSKYSTLISPNNISPCFSFTIIIKKNKTFWSLISVFGEILFQEIHAYLFMSVFIICGYNGVEMFFVCITWHWLNYSNCTMNLVHQWHPKVMSTHLMFSSITWFW